MDATMQPCGASASPATAAPSAADTAPAPPPPATKEARTRKGGSLHERLRARHQEAVQKFRDEARQYNDDVDVAQQARIAELHRTLAESHAITAALVAEEQRRLAACVAEWQKHEDALQRASVEDVLPVYTDLYHPSPDEHGRAKAMALMRNDRLRLVAYFAELRDRYTHRVAAIDDAFRAIEAAEDVRRRHIQEEVRELMASLTRIAVTSTTESQVLAQRILHHTNQQLGQNYLAMQTLATQLRHRELWKHQHYQQQLAQVYRDTQQHMARRHITWAMTVLRSSVFRRPEQRMQSVYAAGQLIAAIRREAGELMQGLTEVVRSLHDAQPSTVTADAQVCGGSGPTGWLRTFQPAVHTTEVFAGEHPRSVLEEAQMRASILVRHCRARSDDFVMRLRAEESARAGAAAVLAAHVCQDVALIAAPLNEEAALLRAASFSTADVSEGGCGSVDGGSVVTGSGDVDGADAMAMDSVDAPLLPLTQPCVEVLAMQAALPSTPAWSQCVAAIDHEGRWFVDVVSRGLLHGCQLLCRYATTSPTCMLVHLEGATDLLFASAGGLLGATRRLYLEWQEREKDYQDDIAQLERQLHALEEALCQDETPAAAEVRYAAGIACLQSIADAHTKYYEDVRSRVAAASSVVLAVGQECVRELCTQLGLALAPLREEEVTEDYVAFQPVKRRSSATAGRRASARASIVAPPVGAASRASVTITAAEAAPRVLATHGEELTEVSAELRFTCMVQRGDGGGSSGDKKESDDDDNATSVTAAAGEGADAIPEPCSAFRDFYMSLLPELQPSSGPLFLQRADVLEWTGLLRTVLLEWGLRLQRQAGENWRLYTTALLADVQRRIADVLRHHRRRPAALQADVYEARVRELAELKNRGEKVLARIAERVSRVHTLQQAFLAQPARSAGDRNLSDERQRLVSAVRAATSANAMKAALHRHDTLCAQYAAALAERCAETARDLEQARDTIEAECTQILRDRAAELSGGDTSVALPADDPIQLRVVHLREQVRETLAESTAAMAAQQQARTAEIDGWQESWQAIVAQSTAEMELFQAVQEATSRLRAHVQTLLSASATEEAALAAGVERLAEAVAAVRPGNAQSDLAASLQALLRREPGSDASLSVDSEKGLPALADVEEAVEQALAAAKAEQRERVRGAPVCVVLAVMDELRLPLYSRGCRLGVLAHAIELWRLSPSHYLLPQALGDEGGRQGLRRGSSAARLGSPRGGRRAKTGSGGGGAGGSAVGSTVMGHTLLPLPSIPTLIGQVGQWAAEVQANADSAVRQHLEAHPGPLHRRLPGMTDGTEAQFTAAVAALCRAQEERTRGYAEKAGPTYRQQVQALWTALQGTAALVTTTLEQEAATAALARVEAVLRPWLRFHARSSQLWLRHRSSAKLSLASQLRSIALLNLTEAEEERAAATEGALQQSWWWALREVQDEAGLHVARCWTALYTYVHLLSGLVSPQHLLPATQALEGGHHRGLRHLLELRAQHERAAAAMETVTVAKREPRLQETMPLHRADQGTSNATNSGKRGGGKGSDKGGAAAKDANGAAAAAAALPPLTWGDVELPGLPLNACAPLVPYCATHPQVPAEAPPAAAPYVPAAADGRAAQQSSRRNNANAGGGASAVAAAGAAAGGSRKRNSTVHTAVAAAAAAAAAEGGASDAAVEMSIPIVVPRLPLALECVQLLRALVRSVMDDDNKAARVIADTFGFWERQETQLRQTWTLTLAELKAEAM